LKQITEKNSFKTDGSPVAGIYKLIIDYKDNIPVETIMG